VDRIRLERFWVFEVEGVSIGGGYSGGADGTVVDRGREEISTLVDCGVELINGRVAARVGWDLALQRSNLLLKFLFNGTVLFPTTIDLCSEFFLMQVRSSVRQTFSS
jgi:hypothetical protein